MVYGRDTCGMSGNESQVPIRRAKLSSGESCTVNGQLSISCISVAPFVAGITLAAYSKTVLDE